MEKDNRVVFGSFNNPDDTVSAIKKLTDDGYQRDQITVYSNKENRRTFDATEETTPKKDEEGSFDRTEGRTHKKIEEGSFDTVDKNSEQRSEHGSFDKVDKDTDTGNDDSDQSVWDKVTDFFTPDTYDYESSSQDPDYSQENDILYPYKDNITQGENVIVVDEMTDGSKNNI